MNKNIIIKSIAALTILTSITGVGTTVVEGIQQTAKAEHNVTKITNTSISPYKGILRVGAGTGFVIGKNTILTNRHVAKDVQVAVRFLPTRMAKMIQVDTIKSKKLSHMQARQI